MKSVSILIPCYNRVTQTLHTIQLLLSSNGWNTEYHAELVVSDSSENDELEKAVKEHYGDKIIYTRPEHTGIAVSKNHAASIAKYPILIFCDSDIEVEPDTIKIALESMEKCNTAAALGGNVIWKGGTKHNSLDRPREEDRITNINGISYIEALYSRFFVTYKEVFNQVGGYDEQLFNMRGEGADLSVRYWRAGFPLVYDPHIQVHHVYEVEEGIIRGVEHPEWGIAKDYLILGLKYNLFKDDPHNFIKSIAANFSHLGDESYYRLLQGIAMNIEFILKSLITLNEHPLHTSEYDFKFLEVFSRNELLMTCLDKAPQKLSPIRTLSIV